MKFSQAGVMTIALGLAAFVPGDEVAAQPKEKPKQLQWAHAFDLSCRPFGKAEFDKQTPKFGVEAFRDNNNGLGLYISQAGSIGVAPGFHELKLPMTSKGPDWVTGLDLPARAAGVREFTKDTKTHSMEIFRDPNTNNWLYITEKGNIAVTAVRGTVPGAGAKAPKWVHSVDLAVRPGGRDWKAAVKYGIEVYRDPNTGNLVYICDTGHIAIIREVGETKTESKAAEWLHGHDVLCRKHNEPDFGAATRKIGIEVFRDETNGNLIFISETGSIAVTTGDAGAKAPTVSPSDPKWTHGLNVKCRAIGEKEFSSKTRTFGMEVFRENNVAAFIYVTEDGNIAALRQ